MLVRDTFHWIRVTEMSRCSVFAYAASVEVSFVPESIFWNLARKR